MKKEYIDLYFIKAIAIILVVFLHVSAPFLYEEQFTGRWYIAHTIDTISRIAVPLFFMTTGILLLDPSKNYSIKDFLVKRFSRILVPFILWSLVYLTLQNYGVLTFENIAQTITGNFSGIVTTPAAYHLWFVYSLIGIYLLIPLFRVLTKSGAINELRYFVILWFIFHNIILFANYFLNIQLFFDLGFFVGYSGFIVLGFLVYYYLQRKNYNLSYIFVAFLLSLIGIFSGFVLLNQQNEQGTLNQYFYEYGNIVVVFASLAGFALIHYFTKNIKNSRLISIVKTFSNTTFGVYLIHPLIIDQLSKILSSTIMTSDSSMRMLGFIVIISTLTIAISYLIVWIVSKIPIVKYIF